MSISLFLIAPLAVAWGALILDRSEDAPLTEAPTAATAVFSPPAPAPDSDATGDPVSVLRYGAIPDDGRSDDAAFRRALRGSDQIYVDPGIYEFDETVRIPSGRRIFGVGPGSVIRVRSAGTSVFLTRDASDVTVESLAFEAPSVASRTYALTDTAGTRIRFRNNHALRIGMVGAFGTTDAEISGNEGSGGPVAGAFGIDLTLSSRVTVRGNRLEHYHNAVQWWGGDSNPANVGYTRERLARDLLIEDNTITYVGAGIWGSRGERIRVVGNTVSYCADTCLDAEGSANIEFRGNTARFAHTAVLMVWFESERIRFIDNVVEQDGGAHWPGGGGGVAMFETRELRPGGPAAIELRGNLFRWIGRSGRGGVVVLPRTGGVTRAGNEMLGVTLTTAG